MALCSSEYTLEYKIEMSLKKLKKEEATIAVQSTMVEMVEFKYHNGDFCSFPSNQCGGETSQVLVHTCCVVGPSRIH